MLFILILLLSCTKNIDFSKIIEYVKEDNYQAIQREFQIEELLKIKDDKDRNILHYSALNNSVNILKYLMNYKESKRIVNNKDKYGNTPLKLAIQKGNKEVVEILLDNGADIHLRDNFLGFTPIMVAAFCGKKEIVRILYSRGANLYDRDLQYNMSIPFWIVKRNNKDMLKFIIEDMKYRSEDLEGLMLEACITPNIQKEILEYIYDICPSSLNYQDPEGITPLLGAIIQGNLDQAVWIIKKQKTTVFHKDKYSNNIIDHFFHNYNENQLKDFVELIKKNFSNDEIHKLLVESHLYHILEKEDRLRIYKSFLD